ncbi:hypothetical protein ERS069937_02646, partial [Streptococcus pneumoniae]
MPQLQQVLVPQLQQVSQRLNRPQQAPRLQHQRVLQLQQVP